MNSPETLGSRSLPRLLWTDELARRFWDDLAGSDYLESVAFSRHTAGLLVDLVQPYLTRSSEILDYGAGDNLYLVREFLSRGYRVSALEPSVAVKERNGDLTGFEGFGGNLSTLEPASFDCIVVSEVIEHLSDAALAEVLKTVATGLKKGGILVVTTPDQENLLQASRYCPTCRQLFHPWGHVRSFSADLLEQTLSQFGFACEELRSVDFSSNRHAVIALQEMRVALRSIADRLSETEARASILPWWRRPSIRVMREISAELVRLAGNPPRDQSKRRHIGNGGTLVAVGRIRDSC